MPQIENTAQFAVECGGHTLGPANTILIQIIDPESEFVIPFHKNFKQIFQFKFYDVDIPTNNIEPITQDQADELVNVLEFALCNDYNVLVHCAAGICRSGAVTEVGTIMGFDAVHDNRMPNVAVKSRMLKRLRRMYGSYI